MHSLISCQAAANPKLQGQHKCHGCGMQKPWSEYSPIVLKYLLCREKGSGVSAARKLVCEACQYPRCAGVACPAGNPIRETTPVHSALDANRNWFCAACRSLWCSVCEQKREETAFSQRMREQGNDDQTRRCLDCGSPACTRVECTTCRHCRNPACTESTSCKKEKFKLHAKFIPKTKMALESFLCGNCASCQFWCSVCEQEKPELAFVPRMRTKEYNDQTRRCVECTSPACTRLDCTTCKQCRDPSCNAKIACKREKIKLNPKLRPRTKTELESFLCSNCDMRCTTCDQRGPEHFSRYMRMKQSASQRKCFACVELEIKAKGCE